MQVVKFDLSSSFSKRLIFFCKIVAQISPDLKLS